MNTFKMTSIFLVLVSLVFSSYSNDSEVTLLNPINNSTHAIPFSVCVKRWKVDSPSLKNAIYKEKFRRNIIVDINLPLDPISEGGKYKSNISLENSIFCQKI